MSDIATRLGAVFAGAFEAMGLSPELGAVRRSDKPDLADFQCNGALAGAKSANRRPRDIAEEVAQQVRSDPAIAVLEIAGPGFLNVRVSDSALAESAEAIRSDERSGGISTQAPEKILLDFGGANVAKAMHVGHLRTAVIGDTLQRLFRFLGDEVISDVHLGDWGLQMGHLITELSDERPELVYFDSGHKGPFPSESPVAIEDLSRLYPQASLKAKADPERLARSQRAVAELQSGRAGYVALLDHFVDVSIDALKRDYGFLGVSFDLWKGEKDADPLIPGMVRDLQARGIAHQDEGAWIIPVEREGDKKAYPPLILLNSRGAAMYATTDLATIVDRVDAFAPDRMLYVVDLGQALHFEQVFRSADLAGFFPEDRMEHIKFGTVNGPDGKRYRTKEGGAFKLADLNTAALQEAKRKMAEGGRVSEDLPFAEREQIAAQVARAALRFADLQNTRTTNYIFDLDRFTSFEGKTGPYLLYQAVRIKSLLKKAHSEGNRAGAIRIESDKERALVLALDGFATALTIARDKRMPHFICEHVYGLAQAFSAFYGTHPIATEPDPVIRASRLALCETVSRQLETGLDILGIEVPDRM